MIIKQILAFDWPRTYTLKPLFSSPLFTPSNIQLRIISNHQTLQLYGDPDAEVFADPFARKHYVEAITGAKFEIQVALGSMFDVSQLHGLDCVRVLVKYDGIKPGWIFDLSGAEIELSGRSYEEPLFRFARTYRTDPVTKQCLARYRTCGNLDISGSTAKTIPRSFRW